MIAVLGYVTAASAFAAICSIAGFSYAMHREDPIVPPAPPPPVPPPPPNLDPFVVYALYAYSAIAAGLIAYLAFHAAARVYTAIGYIAAICAIAGFSYALLQDDLVYTALLATPLGQILAHEDFFPVWALARDMLVDTAALYPYKWALRIVKTILGRQ